MDDLDTLLADAAAEVERAKAQRKARAALPGGFIESDYRPAAFVAMFNAVQCHRCNSTELQFEGLFEERVHRRNVGDKHLVRLPSLPVEGSTVPRIKRYMHHSVLYCNICSDIHTYKEEL